MKAIQFFKYGGYDELKLVNLDIPELLDGQVLVRVTYAAVNPVDHTIRKGVKQVGQLPMILGNEGAGVVTRGNEEYPTGTRVIISCFNTEGSLRGVKSSGTWQEYQALYPVELIKTPDNITDETAAAFAVGFISAFACLEKADFTPGKSVLSIAAGGAVGNAGTQLAKATGASMVITTAGSTTKAEKARSYGFENVIDLSQESILEGVNRITGGKGVDIVIDSVGGNLTGPALDALAPNGILVAIGYSAGMQINVNITNFVWKMIQMRGQSLSSWPDPKKHQKAIKELIPLLADGKIKPAIAKIYDASDVAEAQRYLIEERPFGKVLIRFSH